MKSLLKILKVSAAHLPGATVQAIRKQIPEDLFVQACAGSMRHADGDAVATLLCSSWQDAAQRAAQRVHADLLALTSYAAPQNFQPAPSAAAPSLPHHLIADPPAKWLLGDAPVWASAALAGPLGQLQMLPSKHDLFPEAADVLRARLNNPGERGALNVCLQLPGAVPSHLCRIRCLPHFHASTTLLSMTDGAALSCPTCRTVLGCCAMVAHSTLLDIALGHGSAL
jgi:hypothetical protein